MTKINRSKWLGFSLVFSLGLILVQAPLTWGQYLPTVKPTEELLQEEIQKMISAGHLRTSQTYGPDFRYSRRNSVSTGTLTDVTVEEFDDLFHNPADTIYSLSLAYPYLGTDEQAQLKTYLQSEFTQFKPYLYDHRGTEGAFREFNDVPLEVRANYQGEYFIKSSSPTTLTGFVGWTFHPFNFYALFQYAKIMENADVVLGLLQQNNHPAPQTLPPDDVLQPRPHVLNAYVAGYYGYLGLCQRPEAQGLCPEQTVSSIQSDLSKALEKRIQFLPKTEKELLEIISYEAGGFLWLVPELGSYLYDHAYEQTKFVVSAFEKAAPYWMIPNVDESLRYTDYNYSEGTLTHWYDSSSLFLAKAYALKLSQSELEAYLHNTGLARGDLFYIQNLVATIQAPGESIVPTEDGGTEDGSVPDAEEDPDASVSDGDQQVMSENDKLSGECGCTGYSLTETVCLVVLIVVGILFLNRSRTKKIKTGA